MSKVGTLNVYAIDAATCGTPSIADTIKHKTRVQTAALYRSL